MATANTTSLRDSKTTLVRVNPVLVRINMMDMGIFGYDGADLTAIDIQALRTWEKNTSYPTVKFNGFISTHICDFLFISFFIRPQSLPYMKTPKVLYRVRNEYICISRKSPQYPPPLQFLISSIIILCEVNHLPSIIHLQNFESSEGTRFNGLLLDLALIHILNPLSC